ncbi:MAG: hypothetical protein ABEI57_05580 [Halapricum sp.]
MTIIQLVKAVLEDNWAKSIDGRWNDVPKPEIVFEKNIAQGDLKTTDYLKIQDGGDYTFEPQGFGWTHEHVEGVVTISARSVDRRVDGTKVDGRVRVFGEREESPPYSAERHGGLVGETVRVLKAYRDGVAEWDRVEYGPIRDNSDMGGSNYYRADTDVVLINNASEIDPST